jgi:hypothetical protein
MSDVSHGPGWWLASDGKWYPPETHPDYVPPTVPPPKASTPPTAESEATSEDEPAVPEAVAPRPEVFEPEVAEPEVVEPEVAEPEVAKPEGAEPEPAKAGEEKTMTAEAIRRDSPISRWRGPTPPSSPTPPRGEGQQPSPRWIPVPSARAAPTKDVPPPAATSPLSAPSAPARRRARPNGLVVVVAVVALVGLAVAALVVALVSKSGETRGSGSLPDGLDTASIHIVVPNSGEPSFSGTVAGQSLDGVVSTSISSGLPPTSSTGSGTAIPEISDVFTYTGNLGGTPYVVHVGISSSSPNGNTASPGLQLQVTGNYGSEPISGTAGFSFAGVSGSAEAVSIHGHVGSQSVDGQATATMGTGSVDVTANFTVESI